MICSPIWPIRGSGWPTKQKMDMHTSGGPAMSKRNYLRLKHRWWPELQFRRGPNFFKLFVIFLSCPFSKQLKVAYIVVCNIPSHSDASSWLAWLQMKWDSQFRRSQLTQSGKRSGFTWSLKLLTLAWLLSPNSCSSSDLKHSSWPDTASQPTTG